MILKDQIIDILYIVDYKGDKELFANTLLEQCLNLILTELIKHYPDLNTKLQENKNSITSLDELKDLVDQTVPTGDYIKITSMVNETVIGLYLSTIKASLSSDQRSKLDLYIEKYSINNAE